MFGRPRKSKESSWMGEKLWSKRGKIPEYKIAIVQNIPRPRKKLYADNTGPMCGFMATWQCFTHASLFAWKLEQRKRKERKKVWACRYKKLRNTVLCKKSWVRPCFDWIDTYVRGKLGRGTVYFWRGDYRSVWWTQPLLFILPEISPIPEIVTECAQLRICMGMDFFCKFLFVVVFYKR